jgi:hypothetical protein
MKIFFLIFLSTTFITAFSHVGSRAFEAYTVSSVTFNQGTSIGNIDISGMTEEEALSAIAAGVEQWKNSAKIEISMRENKKVFNPSLLTFLIEDSVELAKNGEPNLLYAQVDRIEFENTIIGLSPSITEFDKLEEELLTNVQFLNNTIQIKLEKYLANQLEKEVVSTIKVPLQINVTDDQTIKIPLAKGSSFSVTEFLAENNIIDDSSIDYFSSAVYQLLLKSNFKIVERHIGNDLPAEIPLGFEAKIDQKLGWDFVVYNPNQDDYTLQITKQDGYTRFDLVGFPFSNTYEIELANKQTFAPKVIEQFDSTLSFGQRKEFFSGKDGSYVEVIRKVVLGSKEMESELISKDYYPPQHRIILVGKSGMGTETTEQTAINTILNELTKTDTIQNEQPQTETILAGQEVSDSSPNEQTELSEDRDETDTDINP